MSDLFNLPESADFWTCMSHTIWRVSDTLESQIYSYFNLLEAAAWFAIAIWMLIRYARNRKSWFELLYVFMFALFGLTDVLESQRVTLWLILCKGLIFANLIAIRQYLITTHYLGKKL